MFLLSWALGAPLPAATPLPATPRADQEVVLSHGTLGRRPVALALGPCTAEACPVRVTDGTTSVTVLDLGAPDALDAPYEVEAFDGGWSLVLSEYDRATLRWRAVDDLGGPALQVHKVQGMEHLNDEWALVWGTPAGPARAWTKSSPPRDAVETTVWHQSLQGAPAVVVREQLARHYTETETHESVDLAAWRVVPGAVELAEVEGPLPHWLVVAGSFPDPGQALAQREATPCLRPFSLLSTSDYPQLTAGLTVLAAVFPDQPAAEGALAQAKSCRTDAFVKRGR